MALCQSLPGPASSQLGMAIGMRRAGIRGGLAAWAGFTLPSAVALTILGLVAATTDLSGAGWVHGLKLAAVAIVAQAVWSMAGTLTPDWPRRAVALVAAAVALAWTTPFAQVAIIAAGALVGRLILPAPAPVVTRSEPSPVSRRVGATAFTVFVALLVGLPVLRVADGQIAAMADAFYRAGALVFGGGHVVLPLLDASVVTPGWVSEGQFLAGYGAAQAVPGPLFTFAAYLGAVSDRSPTASAGPRWPWDDLPALVPAHPGRPAVLGPAPDRRRCPPGAERARTQRSSGSSSRRCTRPCGRARSRDPSTWPWPPSGSASC